MSFASRICSWSIVWVLLFTACAPAFAAPQGEPVHRQEVAAQPKAATVPDPPESRPEIIDFAKRLERSPFAVAVEFAALIANRGPTYQSLLDGRGRLVRSVTAQNLDEWKAKLASLKTPSEQGRWLQLWIAEAEMGLNREPERARKMLTVLCDEFPDGTIEQGVAHYDKAIALFLEGRYAMARDALRVLVNSKMRGYIRAFALNVLRHAEYCASYHAANGAAGITQPTHIDPEAGPAALAVALKSMKRPHDRAFVLGNVPRNGLGNSFLELRDSLPKLGLSGRWVSADKEGLLRLFRFNEGAAMVAHVERDHYVAVTGANQSGVSYMCVDCGPWPGGPKKVTWKQWARMDASNFLAISRKGSAFDQALAILPEKAHTRVQRVPGPTAQPGSVPTGAAQRIVAELVGVAAMSYFSICGVNAGSLPDCTPCWECLDFCPIWTSPAPPGGGANFDPVNLATLSHSYTPDADITVYNPTGPSVAWGHSYHSNTVVTPNGYGMGWSHPYLWTIDTPAFTNDGSISSSGEGFRLKEPGSAEVLFGVRNITAPGPNNPGPVNWPFAAGYPFVVTWQWNTTDSCDEFILTRLDRSKWTFRRVSGAPNSNARNLYFPVKIEDRNGNYIKLNWSQHLFQGLNPFEFTVNVAIGGLDSIKDSSNNTLLQVDYDSTGKVVTKVTGKSPGASPRYVYYVVELKQHTNPGNQDLVANYELTQVSQVTTSTSAAANYTYGYEWIGNGYVRPSDNLDELVPYLYTVTRPSPTGSGTTTTTMKHGYEGYIQWIEDGNGYVTRFLSDESSSSTSETTVASYVNLNASTPVAQYTVGYSNSQDNLRMTSLKNAAGETIATWGFGGSNSASPKRPSSITVNFSGSESKTWNFAYDQYGQPTYSSTPKGITHNTTYSTPSGFPFPVPTQSSTSSGTNTIATTNISYHSNGLVSEVETVVPEGVSVPGTPATQQTSAAYEYDSLGNITKIVTPGAGANTTRVWDLGYTTDGNYTQSAKIGQPIKITDPRGGVTHLRYDLNGNLTELTDPKGNVATATYTADSLAVDTVTTPASGTGTLKTAYIYQYPGGLLERVNSLDESNTVIRSVKSFYGKEGELKEVQDLVASATLSKYTYDELYNVKEFFDGNNSKTTWTRNLNQQVTQVNYPGNTGGTSDRVTFEYDRAGRVVSQVDGRNITTQFEYNDTDELLTKVKFPNLSGQDVTMEYDSFDRLWKVTDPTGVVTSSFDDLGNILQSSRAYTNLPSKLFKYHFYPDGSRSQMETPAGAWNYAYDDGGLCTQMTSPAGTVNYTYWIDGALKTREVLNTSGNPVTYSSYEYNPAGMLKSLTNKTASNGSTRSSYDMTAAGSYDGVLNLKSMAATVSGLTSFTGTLNWNYDSRERLTSETSSARAGVMGSASYDGADNVLTRGSSGWSYNSNNQITPASGQWSYDGNGNATLQRGRACGFDPFNRLGTITKTNEWSVGYTYRADGLMASRAKTVYVYMFGQWMAAESMPTYYFHDGGEPILEMESDMGIEGSTLTVSAINVRGPDGLVARKQGGSWIYYDFDQQGSVSQRLNSSGNVLSSSVYDAYGAETNNGTPTDPFGYCAQWGYWFDRDTGMYLCQARWYDPVTARWVNRDPIGYAGGANLYGYCKGGPVGTADPSGNLPAAQMAYIALSERPTTLYALFANNGTFLKMGHLVGSCSTI